MSPGGEAALAPDELASPSAAKTGGVQALAEASEPPSGTPVWVFIVVPLLAVALLAAGLVLFGIRRRERRTGKPMFNSVEMEKVDAPAATI